MELPRPTDAPSGVIAGEWLLPGETDRAVIVGKTGSGKTVLAQALCDAQPYVVVLDTKGTIRWPGYTLVRSLAAAMKLRSDRAPKIIYRPDVHALRDMDDIERFFQWCYMRGNCCVYVDEVLSIATASTYPFWFAGILTRGRELGTQMYCSTQRPFRCPRLVFSESENAYVFPLPLAQDRQRVEEDCGIAVEDQDALAKYQFLYARQDDEPRGPFRLQIPS